MFRIQSKADRGLFSQSARETANALLSAVDKGEFSMIGSVSDRDLQIKRNADSIRSLQLEGDILKELIEGYGMVSISNGSSVICQSIEDQSEVHESLVTHAFDALEVELKSLPSVISTSMETAFVSAKRGQCGAIYGAAKNLKALISSLQRDELNYHVLPMWLSQGDVQAESKAIESQKADKLRRQQAMIQKKKDDAILEQTRKQWTEQQRQERQRQLRQQNGALARALEGAILDEVKAYVEYAERGDEKTHVKQEWPYFAKWYQDRTQEQWEPENITSELNDYGVVEWKNRVLEAGFVSITVKMKHRALGEHKQTCFIFGHIVDREFEIEREPIVVPCTSEDKVEQYKTARSFSSRWIAD